MKKFSKFFSMMALASVAILSSCSNDDDPKPAPSISAYVGSSTSGNSGNFAAGTDVSITVAVNAPADIDQIDGTVTVGGSTQTLTDFPIKRGFDTKTTHNVVVGYTSTNSTAVFTFTVKDKEGATSTTTYTVNPALTEKADQTIYNVLAPTGFYGAYNLETLTGVSSTATDKDMQDMTPSGTGVYSKGWDGANGTVFVKANSFDYASANWATAKAAFAAGTSTSSVTNAALNDIYIAKLRNQDNYAVIKVTAVVDDGQVGAGKNQDHIKFNVKK